MKVDFVKHSLDETLLKCPQCDFERGMHIASVSVLRGSDKTTVTSKGILVTGEKNPSRGVIISLGYHCENGHAGEVLLSFHKGSVYVEHKSLPPSKDIDDIWRS